MILWLSWSTVNIPQKNTCIIINSDYHTLYLPFSLQIHTPSFSMDTMGKQPIRTTATCSLAPWLAIGLAIWVPLQMKGRKGSCLRMILSLERWHSFPQNTWFSPCNFQYLSLHSSLWSWGWPHLCWYQPQCAALSLEISLYPEHLFSIVFSWNIYLPPSELAQFEGAIRFYWRPWFIKLT